MEYPVEIINRLLREGLGHQDITLKCFTQDAVAHNETLGLISHNSYNSCPTCRVRGRRFRVEELCRMNRQDFELQNLFFPVHGVDEYRTDANMHLQLETNQQHETALYQLDEQIDLIWDFSGDHLHQVDIGEVKALLGMIKSGRLQNPLINRNSLSQLDALVSQVNNLLKSQGQFDRLPRCDMLRWCEKNMMLNLRVFYSFQLSSVVFCPVA